MRTTHSVMVGHLLTVTAALAVLTATADAQLVNDGETNVLVSVTTNSGFYLTVGSNGSFTTLGITGGSVVTAGIGYIGFSAGANSNTVFVSGANSRWTNSSVTVGSGGDFNQLIISNGGTVGSSFAGYVGGYDGNNNSVLVTGPNSKWVTHYGLSNFSSFNRYSVANGGAIIAAYTYIGGSSNFISVSGVGSVWNGFGMFGAYDQSAGSSFNLMVISNGGKVFGGGFFGPTLIGADGDSNSVIITGAGSLLSNSMLGVGGEINWAGGKGNQLLISNGGTVLSTTNLIVGYAGVWSNNLVRNDGGFITVTNAAGSGILDVRNGMLVLNGGTNNVDRLLLTNGVSSLLQFNGGILRTRRLTNDNASALIVGDGTAGAKLILEGTNVHRFANGLLIQGNATLTGTGTINGSVTNCGTIFLTNADQMIFTGPVVNKGVIIAVTGTPRFGSTFSNLGTLITTASINVANVSVSGPDIVLQFNSVSNYLHEVQASTNVSSGLWQSLTNGLLGTGSPLTFTDPGGATNGNRTYRVLLH